MIDQIINDIMTGRQTKHPNLLWKNTTPLISFLTRHKKDFNQETLEIVRIFIKKGASIYMADNRGMTPFYLLVCHLGGDFDKEIVDILIKSKSDTLVYPNYGNSPIFIIMNQYNDGRLDGDDNHPVRRLLRHMIKNHIIDESGSKMAIRAKEAIRNNGEAFVHDLLRTVEFNDEDLENILMELVIRDRDLSSYPELIRPGIVSMKIVLYAALYRKPELLQLLLPHILDEKNRLLDHFITSSFNENPNNAIVNRVRNILLENGAIASENIMTMLVKNNKLHLVRILHDHGSPLALPSQIPSSPRTYNWVRKEMQRNQLIRTMIHKDLPTKKARKNQTTWRSVARQTSRLPPDVIRQLHRLMP